MTGVPAAALVVVVPPPESFPSPPHPASASTAIGMSMYLIPGIRLGPDFGFDYLTAATISSDRLGNAFRNSARSALNRSASAR